MTKKGRQNFCLENRKIFGNLVEKIGNFFGRIHDPQIFKPDDSLHFAESLLFRRDGCFKEFCYFAAFRASKRLLLHTVCHFKELASLESQWRPSPKPMMHILPRF